MILGTFNGELYWFNNQWYKPKFLAHSGRLKGVDDMKPILEAGHAFGKREGSYTRSILVASQITWNSKIAGTPFAGTWGDLCWLHYWYPSSASDTGYPAWAQTFKDYNHLLIKEYDDGKVAYLKSSDPLELYAFFDVVNPPAETPVVIPTIPSLSGKVINVDLTIKGTITLT